MSFYGVYLHFFIFFAPLKFNDLQNTKNDELHKKHPNHEITFQGNFMPTTFFSSK